MEILAYAVTPEFCSLPNSTTSIFIMSIFILENVIGLGSHHRVNNFQKIVHSSLKVITKIYSYVCTLRSQNEERKDI